MHTQVRRNRVRSRRIFSEWNGVEGRACRHAATVKGRRSACACTASVNVFEKKKCPRVPRLCLFGFTPPENLNIEPRASNGPHVVHDRVAPLCLVIA
ncbi:hypothetical protein VNO78_32333 [Psophocarpus tetragonolobus]|uniref:Uncharacterized protein n=1 Tax=Psophocarpus tetragonolobus TaxID=3891 RepID=A0AAN9NW96_PSOTE